MVPSSNSAPLTRSPSTANRRSLFLYCDVHCWFTDSCFITTLDRGDRAKELLYSVMTPFRDTCCCHASFWPFREIKFLIKSVHISMYVHMTCIFWNSGSSHFYHAMRILNTQRQTYPGSCTSTSSELTEERRVSALFCSKKFAHTHTFLTLRPLP